MIGLRYLVHLYFFLYFYVNLSAHCKPDGVFGGGSVNPTAFAISVGTFGAILQELLYWYNAKTKLNTDEYKDILASTGYWVVVAAMAIGSGIAAYLWFTPEQQAAKTYLLFGAAFPVLFKKAVDAFIPRQTKLGTTERAKKQSLENYFKAS